MIFHDLQYITDLVKNTQVMSDPLDILITNVILHKHSPNDICEFGTGNGAWALTQFKSGIIDSRYMLLDNFSWHKMGWIGHRFWPKNSAELVDYINKQTSNSMNFDVIDVEAKDYINEMSVCDVIRVDIDMEFQLLHEVIDKLTDNGVLLMDDVVFNMGLNRIVNLIDLKRAGKIFPLWIGNKESAWTINESYRDHLYEITTTALSEQYDFGLSLLNEKTLNPDRWKYFTTREHNFFKKFTSM